MIRKRAIVIAFTFLFLGFIFTSVDTPFVHQNNIGSEIQEIPENTEQIADGPVPQEPLRLNVISNPSFEDWDSVLDTPEDWQVQTSAYQFGDRAYTEVVANGTYAGYVEGKGGPAASASAYITTGNIPPATDDLLEPGLSLSFNWNALAVPDLQLGSTIYLRLVTNGGLGYRYFNYYLVTGTTTFTNDSRNVYILGNDTINQWNDFDRNITEDFIESFGLAQLTSTDYVSSIYFFATSPPGATDVVRLVFDDVVLYSSTFSGFLSNGDFETGTGSSWFTYQSTLGHVEQSFDSTVGSHSVNITAPQVSVGSGWARCYRYLNPQAYYYALVPGMTTIRTDWKYNDTVGAGAGQYAYLRLTFQNSSYYYVHYYFGIGDDTIHLTNDTSNYYVKVPGFGVRDAWQTSEFDLYDAISQIGFGNLPLTQLSFYVYETQPDSTAELLIDNFNILSSPANDPTFEFENTPLFDPPFLGWSRSYYTAGAVTSTPDSHSGLSACNITTVGQQAGIYRDSIYTEFDNKLATDFWWRLDHIDTSGLAGTYVQFEFFNTTQFYYIRYMLGKSPSFPIANSSSIKHVLVENINQIGTWNNLARNITDDFESSSSISSDSWHISGISLYVYSAPGLKLTCLFDDLQFIDTEPPVISAVDQSMNPVYYEVTSVSVTASDMRPGVSSVAVNYTTDGWNSWSIADASYGASTFDADIPAQPYGTLVQYFVIATDGCGVQAIDDNAGAYYSYTVDDDVAPVIDSPADVEYTAGETGNVIDWDPTDLLPSSYEVFVDDVSTFTGSWNDTSEHIVLDVDGLAVGSYNYTCVVFDEAGNTATDTVMVSVVAGPTAELPPSLIVAAVGIAGILLVAIVVIRMKK